LRQEIIDLLKRIDKEAIEMGKILHTLLFSILTCTLHAQSEYYNFIKGNRVSKDSVLNLIADYAEEHPGYTLSGIIVKTTEIGDSTIHRIVFEKHHPDTALPKIRKWEPEREGFEPAVQLNITTIY